MSLTLHCLKYAASVLPEAQAFDGGCADRPIPIAFALYLIRADGCTVLVDAGCDDMPGFAMTDHRSPVEVLAEAGVTPAEVTDVILTHAHHDHAAGARHFPDATFYLQRAEYEAAKAYLPPDASLVLFDGEYRLHDRIRIVEIGGHTVGSCVVEVSDGEITHVLAGDECYLSDNLTRRLHTGATYDHRKAEAFLDTYGGKEYRVHTCHDIHLKTEQII